MTFEEITSEISYLLERRRVPQARARISAALQQFPDNPVLLLQSAWTEYFGNDLAAALMTLEQVLLVDPDNESARFLHFQILFLTDRFAEAEKVIIDLLREFPEHAYFYGCYAKLMLCTMNNGKARELALEGLKFDVDDTNCLSAISLCDFVDGKPNTDNHSLQQLIQQDPDSLDTLLLIVQSLEARGDQRGAHRVAQELVRAQPDNEELVGIAAAFKAANHWSMLPLRPLQKWGWMAAILIWVTCLLGVHFIAKHNPAIAGIAGLCVFSYAVYSWVWPPLLRRWILK